MKEDNKNKKKIHAEELLQKLKPYIEEKSILSENTEFIKRRKNENDGDGQLIESTETAIEEEEIPELPSLDEEFAKYLANEARALHGNIDEEELDLMSVFGSADDFDEEDEQEELEDFEVTDKNEIDFNDKAKVSLAIKRVKKRYAAALLGMIFAAVLLVFSLLAEGLSHFGFEMPGMLNMKHYPVSALLICLQIVVLAVACSFPTFVKAFKALLKGKVESGTVFSLYAAVLTVYYVAAIFIGEGESFVSYNTVLMLSCVFALADELVSSETELHSLLLSSSGKSKYMLVKADKMQSGDVREMVGRYLESDTSYLFVKKGTKISRFNAQASAKSHLRALVPVMMFVSAVISFAFAAFELPKSGLYEAVKLALTVWFMCTPLSLSFAFCFPAYLKNKKFFKKNATVIGEETFLQYKTPACLTLDDKYLFSKDGSVSLVGIKGYGNIQIDRALGYAAAVFSKLDCPLGRVFKNTASDYKVSQDVDVAAITENGIEAAVEGSSVLIGNYDYVKKYGVPSGQQELEMPYFDTYILVDKKSALKVTLKYTPSAKTEKTVKELVKRDVNVVIKTCDPNINMDMLYNMMGVQPEMPIRILRAKGEESYVSYDDDECSCGLFAVGDINSLASCLMGCTKVGYAMKAGAFFAFVSLLCALIILAVMTLTVGNEPTPIFIALYQLFWVLPVLLVDRFLL